MVDFAKLREQQRKKMEDDRAAIGLPLKENGAAAASKPSVSIDELFKGNESHKGYTELEAVDELIDNGTNVNEWESNFLRSIKKWMLSSNYNGLSVKQKQTFEKICRNNNLHIEASKIPTRDNRYASNEYVPPNENRNSAPAKHFDSYDDDDIPF